jgi:hypothetical protein
MRLNARLFAFNKNISFKAFTIAVLTTSTLACVHRADADTKAIRATVVSDGWNRGGQDSHIAALTPDESYCKNEVVQIVEEAAKTNPKLKALISDPHFLIQLDINHASDPVFFEELADQQGSFFVDQKHMYIRVAQMDHTGPDGNNSACDPTDEALHYLHPRDYAQWQQVQLKPVYDALREAQGALTSKKSRDSRGSSVSLADTLFLEKEEERLANENTPEPVVHHRTGFFDN